MAIKESYLEKSCIEYAKLFGIKGIKLSIQSNIGYPDRLFIINGGRPLFVEFKSISGKLSRKQVDIIDDLQEKGYNVAVCDSLNSFKQTLRDTLK